MDPNDPIAADWAAIRVDFGRFGPVAVGFEDLAGNLDGVFLETLWYNEGNFNGK